MSIFELNVGDFASGCVKSWVGWGKVGRIGERVGRWVVVGGVVGISGVWCGGWGCYTRSVDGRKWKIWKPPPHLVGYGSGCDPASNQVYSNIMYNIHYI